MAFIPRHTSAAAALALLGVTGIAAVTVAAAPPVPVAPGTPQASPPVTPAPGTSQAFTATVTPVSPGQLRHSWRRGCPVGPDDLRMITMTHWGFDGRPHTGKMVINKSVAGQVVSVFRKLYGQRFPIRRMQPVEAYKGSDDASMAADNTSAFNCRRVGTSGTWSQHAYGLAIDVNTRENPYIHPYPGGTVDPPNAKDYVRRPLDRPGVINPGDDVVRAFEKIGWVWGGSWSSSKDYQHFSQNGR
ncbi:M15 family metallopeptidase [Streptosporangium sp. NPDC023825]|uniref:M15 family metallopeptidase n=1 Tax=Streptosporangium sp. NPDC023825 TaxID=3154909 RepID=UPI0034170F2E